MWTLHNKPETLKKYENTVSVGNFSCNFSILMFIEFIKNKNILFMYEKQKKLDLMLINSKKFFKFNFKKIKNVSEIEKILKLQTNKIYYTFKDASLKTKINLKKNFFISRSFYRQSRNFIDEKYKNIDHHIYPVTCWNSLKSTVSIKKKYSDLCYNEKILDRLGNRKNFSNFYNKKHLPGSNYVFKKKIAIENLYCIDLPEYTQIHGFFDSTGRRIHSYGNILDQTLHVLKNSYSLVSKLKLNFQMIFEEIVSYLLDFQTGKNDLCKCCFIKNQIKNNKIFYKEFLIFKWKILIESINWTKKYSIKNQTKVFIEYRGFSSDKSIENLYRHISNKKIYNSLKSNKKNSKIRALKYPFENLNLYSGIFMGFVFPITFHQNLVRNYFCFNYKNRRILKSFDKTTNCIFDIHTYKESFISPPSALYEFFLFVFIWVFYENLNSISITIEILSNVFKKSFLYFKNYLEKLSTFNRSEFLSNIHSKSFKNLICLKNTGFFLFSSKYEIEIELKKILEINLTKNNVDFIWFLCTENSSYQKLEWFKRLLKLDKIELIKEFFVEKLKNLLKMFSKKKYKNFKNHFELFDYKICNLQIFNEKDDGYTCVFLSILDPKKKFQIKQIKIKYDPRLIIPLIVLICVKYKILFLFLFFEKKKNESLLIHIKNQLTKFCNLNSNQISGEHFKLQSKNVLNLMQCIAIDRNNVDVNSNFNYSKKFSKFRHKSYIFTLFQLISKGPLVYLWYLKKSKYFVDYNSLKNRLNIFLIRKFPDVLYFSIKNSNFQKKLSKKIYFENSKIQNKNMFSCFLGPQKLHYILNKSILSKKNNLIDSDHFVESESFSKNLPIETTNFLSLKNILNFLWKTRIDNYCFYIVLKRTIYHTYNLKWHYNSIYNVSNISKTLYLSHILVKVNNLNFLESKIKEHYLLDAIEMLSYYVYQRFIPKKIYYNLKNFKVRNFPQLSYGLIKSWRETFVESNKNGTLSILEDFLKPQADKIYGVLTTGYNFFIEKNSIFSYRPRFKYLILKKLTSIPAKIVSIYPKISQIKFSSLIDDDRFICFYPESVPISSGYLSIFYPLSFLEKRGNVFFCHIKDILGFLKDKDNGNWMIYYIKKNFFGFSFIIDKKLKYIFSFQINLFYDKKLSNYIYQVKKNIFLGSQKFWEKLFIPFEKHLNEIIKNENFIGCGSKNLLEHIKKKKCETEKVCEFFFSFIENSFYSYMFVTKNVREIGVIGIFTYKYGTYFFENKRFNTIESLKNMFLKK